ncbi:hypothetical protein Vadar_030495 [Vaccinium darrowii]|uniref:Uncharacterized protein n=1 Tax=Vaccinium darrowii TaxID=229202 RepID=A0ACB7YQI7_9ERIC|nr:hypothetical protein Vadar_030495 [Vaccinium darrowii]
MGETIPNKLEAEAFAEILDEEDSKIPAWFSFNLKDGVNVVSGDSISDNEIYIMKVSGAKLWLVLLLKVATQKLSIHIKKNMKEISQPLGRSLESLTLSSSELLPPMKELALKILGRYASISLPCRCHLALTKARSEEVDQARKYEIHSSDLLLTSKALESALLGPEVSTDQEFEMSKAKTDKALLAALRVARGTHSQGQVVTRKRLTAEANVQTFVAANLTKSKNTEEEREKEKKREKRERER